MEQQFDAVGNRTGLSAAINGTADFADSFEFDFLSRMTSVRQTGQTGGNPVADKRVDFAYNALSQFTSIERFADLGGTQLVVDSDYLYDHAARLTDLTHRQGSTVLADYNWMYDAFSRVTSLWSPTDGSVTYSYDDTDQLTGANYSQLPDESFSYDLTGNRTMTGYVTGANNRLLSDGTYNYIYDDEGNRISKTKITTGEVTEYSWDHRNRLVAIVERDAQSQVTQTVSYSYDCFDRRIAKVITPVVGPSELEQYIYDGEHIALRFENGNLANRYLHGPVIDQILADEQIDLGTGQTDRLLWPLTDNLGSVRDLAEYNDTTGITAIVDHIIYSAFGDILSKTNPSLDHLFGYTGRETDPESDLLFYRARYYDPLTGRFISEDPIGFAAGDVNVNRYVGNEPTGHVDPSGLAEGHHWIPLQVAYELFLEGKIKEADWYYLAGRYSGELKNGHTWWTEYDQIDHEEYSCEVKRQFEQWLKAKNRRDFDLKKVVDNIRNGKNWNGTPNDTLARFNFGVFDDMVGRSPGDLAKVDGGTREEIIRRGQISLRDRGKIAILAGIAGGLGKVVDGLDAKDQAATVAKILRDGEGIRNAKAAALRGDLDSLELALTGMGNPMQSVYMDLLLSGVPFTFANTFRDTVQSLLECKRRELDLLEGHMRRQGENR
ncbi:MAG: RHS repeat-associated core domain-containing protein [Planctomycetes bacterium]|nr:RHS repeat-associated core domain-containing protein [Planctomycetota bacterium]